MHLLYVFVSSHQQQVPNSHIIGVIICQRTSNMMCGVESFLYKKIKVEVMWRDEFANSH